MAGRQNELLGLGLSFFLNSRPVALKESWTPVGDYRQMIVWNILFFILVAIPFFTGGLWIKDPSIHLQLEYTQVGPAAVVLSLWLWWQAKKGVQVAEKNKLCALGLSLWQGWSRLLEKKSALTLVVAWLIVGTSWFFTSLARHRALQSGAADLGIFTNAIWNVAHGGYPFSSIKGNISLLADHQIFLLYPLGLFFTLWPSPIFLLFLQALGLSSGGIFLYYLTRQRTGSIHPLLPWVPLSYWFCGPLRAANRFDFHPEVFMLPLFLSAAWLLQEPALRRRLAGALLLLLALSTKESAGPVACGIGAAWLLGAGPDSTRGFTRPLGLVVILLGLGALWLNSVWIPKALEFNYAYGDLYAPLGTTPLALALSPFLHPLQFFGRIFSLSRFKFLLGLLLPLGFVPLGSAFSLIASLPGFLMLFLTNGDFRISLGYHYSIEPMVGLLFGLPMAISSRWIRERSTKILPTLLLASLVSFGRSDPYYWRLFQPTAHQAWVRDEILPRIPQDLSLSASYALVPHTATRRWVNHLPIFLEERKAPVDCVLIDESVNNTPLSSSEIRSSIERLKALRYHLEYQCGSLSVFSRNTGANCLPSPVPVCREAN